MHNIFATEAPKHWEKGYSVVPGERGTKTAIKGWNGYNNNIAKPDTQEEWCKNYPDYNIALATGLEVKPGFRISALDDDHGSLETLIKAVAGECPSGKKGQKGKTFFVLAEASLKSEGINLHSGSRGLDFLCNGKICILPPSQHPSGIYYEWVGKPLYDCSVDEFPVLTSHKLNLLRCVVSNENLETIIAGQGTHEAVLKLTASLVSKGASDEEIFAIIKALIPANYSGDSLKELPGMIDDARKKGFDNNSSLPLDVKVTNEILSQEPLLAYVPGEGFLKYREGHWGILPDYVLQRKAMELVTPHLKPGRMLMPTLKNILECVALSKYSENFGRYSQYICCNNGTVDITSGKLLEWSPKYELRYKLDIEYNPDAECPTYEEQLHATFQGNEKAMQLFDEYAGLTLIPDMSFQKALYLVGPGGSGKSTLLKVLESMHNPNAVSVTPLDKIDNERYLTDVARKLVCISFDVQTYNRVFGEAFVRITGGDLVATRKLFKEVEGRVIPTVRFVGSMNQNLPKFTASPDALERRLIFLLCGAKVAIQDKNRFEKIIKEKPGILARWIKAVQRLYERGYFDIPAESEQEVSDYLHSQDPVEVFASEYLTPDPNSQIPVSEISGAYNEWAEFVKEERLRLNVIGKRLRQAGLKGAQIKKPNSDSSVRVIRAKWKKAPISSLGGPRF